ncbi:MAG: transporter substrate-binding domain-containing protein [Epsilonproteobacteria bacterium]|nr:transporter substrate-binding domain-containing protein [Campylobacterota bacterium]
MKHVILFCLLLLQLHSDDNRTYKVGIYNNKPKIFIDNKNRPQGFFVDILEDIARSHDLKLEYIPCRWELCMDYLEQGKLDIMPDVAYSQERAQKFVFHKEIILTNFSILYAKESDKARSILALDKKRVALLKESIQLRELQELARLFDVSPLYIFAENFEEAFLLVKKGKADFAAVNRYFGTAYAQEYDLQETSILLNPSALKFAFSHAAASTQLLSIFDESIVKFKADPDSAYYAAKRRWLEPKERIVLPQWAEIALLFASVLLILLIIATFSFRYLLYKKIAEVQKEHSKNEMLQKEKIEEYKRMLLAMVTMIEQRDSYTAGHSQRVADYSKMIADEMGCSEKEITLLYEAGILHDIGKVATPDAILLKPDKLSTLEYEIIKGHAEAGYTILNAVPMFAEIAKIVYAHHERFDGSGYPLGLKGDEIPLLSRIMMVADAFDAITTNRIYKHKKSPLEAIKIIESLSGEEFHPDVVAAASRALCSVTPPEGVDQNPKSSIEEHRFAYYYKDPVTQLNNSKYLKIYLAKPLYELGYKSFVIISLHHFDAYNRKYGWERGNELLHEFARLLEELFKNELLFRIHANDFILLAQHDVDDGDLERLKRFSHAKELGCTVRQEKIESIQATTFEKQLGDSKLFTLL